MKILKIEFNLRVAALIFVFIGGILFGAALPMAAQDKVRAVPVYHIYLEDYDIDASKYVGQMNMDYYTANKAARDKILSGKKAYDQGTEFYVMPAQIPGSIPLYRFERSFKPDGSGDTSNLFPGQQHLVVFQQSAQKPAGHFFPSNQPFGYMMPTKTAETVPLYKLFYPLVTTPPTIDEDYFYTTSAAEKDKRIKVGYQEQGIVGYVWKTDYLFDPDAPKFDTDARIYTINKAFRQVFGQDSDPAREAYWLSVWKGNINAYGDIVSVETRRLNDDQNLREQMIVRASQVSFGEPATREDLFKWRDRKEIFADIIKANTTFLYSPEGADRLTATIVRYLREKKGREPSEAEVKAVLVKVVPLKWNFSSMHNL